MRARNPAAAQIRSHVVLAALVAAFILVLPARGHADQAPAESPWILSLYKTITYELAANLSDIPLYSMVLGGAAAGMGLFTAVNVTTALAAYYTHEVAWNLYGPPVDESPETALEVGVKKTIVYRVISSTRNIGLAYAVTGSPWAVFNFMLINNVTDTVIYAGNEYAWWKYGPVVDRGHGLRGPVVDPLIPASPVGEQTLAWLLDLS